MIPREILKNLRQIELRTNRIVTETLAGALFSRWRSSAGFRAPCQMARILTSLRSVLMVK